MPELWERTGGGDAQIDRILAEAANRQRRASNPVYEDRLARFTEFLADTMEGRGDPYLLRETLSTSDFPILMGDVLDRQLLANYTAWPTVWPAFAKRGSVRDFRSVRRVALNGLEGRLYPSYKKPELTEVKENNNLSETGYTYAVDTYEKSTSLSWRMFVNDDLDAFRELPQRLARGAARTEDYFATQLFVDANGPISTFYTSGNKNQVKTANGAASDNPPLSIAALQSALIVLASQVDADGEPIFIETVTLVVPPALEITARNILNATQLWINTAGGTIAGLANSSGVEQRLQVDNWMRNRVKLVVAPYIPLVATSANGNTSWFLFADPGVGRPAMEIGFLRGFETPGLFQKDPDTRRIGTGTVDPMMGDFDTNEIRYKVMHVIGGTLLDAKMTVASNGSGS